MSLSHKDRWERRRDISKWVAAGNSVESTALKFEVTSETVANSCREFSVAPSYTGRLTKPASSSEMEIVAALLGGKSRTDVTKERGVSRQYVQLVCERARNSGLIKQLSRLAGWQVKL